MTVTGRVRVVRRAGGFTLLEVVVGLVVLEVALLGAVGTLTLAQRLLSRAELLHLATQGTAEVADSLENAGAVQAGALITDWGRVRWSPLGEQTGVYGEGPAGEPLVELWIAIDRTDR